MPLIDGLISQLTCIAWYVLVFGISFLHVVEGKNSARVRGKGGDEGYGWKERQRGRFLAIMPSEGMHGWYQRYSPLNLDLR
jgi:hypothetical protein